MKLTQLMEEGVQHVVKMQEDQIDICWSSQKAPAVKVELLIGMESAYG